MTKWRRSGVVQASGNGALDRPLRRIPGARNVAPQMKVEVENQPQGMATLRIELPPEDVRKEWDAIASNYSRYARIPGYRPGKAPRQVIEKKFR